MVTLDAPLDRSIVPGDSALVATVTGRRTLRLVVGEAEVYSFVNGVETVDPGYAAEVLVDADGILQVSVTKVVPWVADDVVVWGVDDAVASFLVGTWTITARSPHLEESHVPAALSLMAAVTWAAAFDTAFFRLNGVDLRRPEGVATRVDYDGGFTLVTTPRRRLAGGVVQRVALCVERTVDDVTYTAVDPWRFHTLGDPGRDSPSTALDATLPDDLVACEALRRVARTVLHTPTSRTGLAALCVWRVDVSPLAFFKFDEYRATLGPGDVADVTGFDSFVPVELLWPTAVREAAARGVATTDLDVVARAWASAYPQERIAGLAALLLLLLRRL